MKEEENKIKCECDEYHLWTCPNWSRLYPSDISKMIAESRFKIMEIMRYKYHDR